MTQLGDFVDDRTRKELASKNLVPGRVLLLFVRFTHPPKEKLMVLLTQESPYLFFIINTWVAPFIRQRPKLLASQMGLLVSDNKFLKHDSILDCSLVRGIGDEDLRNQLVADGGRVKGDLDLPVKKQIVEMVKKASTIVPRDKARIIRGLS